MTFVSDGQIEKVFWGKYDDSLEHFRTNNSLLMCISGTTCPYHLAESSIVLPGDSGKWRYIFKGFVNCFKFLYCQTWSAITFLPILSLNKRTDTVYWLLAPSAYRLYLSVLLDYFMGWAKLMSKREPVNIKPALLVYNSAMVCLSAYMFCEVLVLNVIRSNSQTDACPYFI